MGHPQPAIVTRLALIAVAAAFGLQAHVRGQIPDRVLYTTSNSHPSSLIPGLGTLRFREFREVSVSPHGDNIAISARANVFSGTDGIVLVNGQVLIREHTTALPWDPSHTWPEASVAINDDGTVAVTAFDLGGDVWVASVPHPLTGPWTIKASNLGRLRGVLGALLTDVHAPRIDWNGEVSFVGGVTGAVCGATRVFYRRGVGEALAKEGVTPLAGPTGTNPLTSLPVGGSFIYSPNVTSDGSHFAYLGGAPGAMVVMDGVPVAASGWPLAGSGFTDPVRRLFGFDLGANGKLVTWGSNRGNNVLDTRPDWVAVDGAVVALSDTNITSTSSDKWFRGALGSHTFKDAAINGYGDVAINGYTGTFGSRGPEVLVANDLEIARHGDPLDLDNNGVYDENATISTFVRIVEYDYRGFVTCLVAFNAPGPIGSGTALMKFHAGVNYVRWICEGEINSTGQGAKMQLVGSHFLADDDLEFLIDRLPVHSLGYLLVAPDEGSTANPGGSQGTLCISGPIGRYVNSVATSGTTGTVTLTPSTGAIPSPTGLIPLSSGQDLKFQFWYRDANPTQTSNFSDAIEVRLR